jgi:hypothetical protein
LGQTLVKGGIDMVMKSTICRTWIILLAGAIIGCSVTVVQAQSGQKVTFSHAYVAPQIDNPKISSSLKSTIAMIQQASPGLKKEFRNPLNRDKYGDFFRIDENDNIQVYIELAELSKETQDKLASLGIQAQAVDPQRKIVQAMVPICKVDHLSSQPFIHFIRLPNYLHSNKGAVTTLGDTYMRTNEVRRDFNYDGTGVRVGVISSGLRYASQSVLTGDLPTYSQDPCTTPPGGFYGDILSRSFGGNIQGDGEGTAILEIIHDIAPGAKLYFASASTDIELIMAKNWLATQHCDIIVDDFSVLNSGPYDGTSPVSLASADLVRQGIAYYSAVGNFAESHYAGYFTDDPQRPNKIHNFVLDPTGQTPSDETLDFLVYPDIVVTIFLCWYEPFGQSGDDMDLYVLDPDLLDFKNPIAESVDLQLGDGYPTEQVSIHSLTGNVELGSLVVARKNADLTPRRFDIFFWPPWGVRLLQYIVPEGSIGNNSDAGGGAIAVGAVDVNTAQHLAVESFSSHGPTIDGRMKPEVASFDGVATTVPDFELFYGTSAAVAHVGGVAALLKQLLPWAGPDALNYYLQAFAVDLAPPGPDNISGSGRVIAYPIFDSIINTGIEHRIKTYNFSQNTENWQPVNVEPVFSAPTFEWKPGYLVITSTSNTNCFGFWNSPPVEFLPSPPSQQVSPGKLYRAKVHISTDAGPNDFPQFRIRIGSKNNASVAVTTISSVAGNDLFPGITGRDYYVFYVPPYGAVPEGLYVAVDLLNFDPGDSPTASLYVENVEMKEFDLVE